MSAEPRHATISDIADLADIEEAFVAHWSLFGRWPGARLLDENGVLRFETPLRKLPYNGVIRTTIDERGDEVVARVIDRYSASGSDFLWLDHPSARPHGLGDLLAANGLKPVESATGMSLDLDLDTPQPPPADRPTGVTLREAADKHDLHTYENLILAYWELDEADRQHIRRLDRHLFHQRIHGRRWLAFLDGTPVGKAYLSLAGPPGVAAIFGMWVRPDARHHGIAGALTRTLIHQAWTLERRKVVLHASDMATGVYRRAGFVPHCRFTFYATAPLWSGA